MHQYLAWAEWSEDSTHGKSDPVFFLKYFSDADAKNLYTIILATLTVDDICCWLILGSGPYKSMSGHRKIMPGWGKCLLFSIRNHTTCFFFPLKEKKHPCQSASSITYKMSTFIFNKVIPKYLFICFL